MKYPKILIYSLNCPITGEVHYIGKTIQGLSRPADHLVHSHSQKINEWVQQLSMIGLVPVVEIQEEVNDEADLDARERWWINKYDNEGHLLFNYKRSSPLDTLDKYSKGEDPLMGISLFILARMKEQGVKQVDIVEATGMARMSLHTILKHGKGNPTVTSVSRVLSLLGCRLECVVIDKGV